MLTKSLGHVERAQEAANREFKQLMRKLARVRGTPFEQLQQFVALVGGDGKSSRSLVDLVR